LGEAEGGPADMLRPAGDDELKVWPVSTCEQSDEQRTELLETVGEVTVARVSLATQLCADRRGGVRNPPTETMADGYERIGKRPVVRLLWPFATRRALR
jgi:hypothetical protein